MKVLLLYDGKHSIDLLGMLQDQNFQLFEEIIKLEDMMLLERKINH